MSLDPAYDVLAEGEVPLAGNFTPRKEVAALRCACSAVCPLDLDHGLLLPRQKGEFNHCGYVLFKVQMASKEIDIYAAHRLSRMLQTTTQEE